jgi:hypothetical protein
MKLLLIAVSLLVNVAFVAAFSLRPALVPPAFRDYFSHGPSSASEAASDAAAKPKPAAKPAITHANLWSTLNTDDLPALVARLRAAGFPIYAIRAIVQAAVDARYGARMRALALPDPDAPFWKSTQSPGMDAKRMAEYMQLANERTKLMRDLLGAFVYHDDGSLSTADARRYGTLPQSKIDQLERINADYADLTNQVRAAMNGVTLPEDREKLALLDREKRADLAALLTPQELENYDMRTSDTTARLRSALALFNATEDEFRTIYQINAAFADKINLTSVGVLTADFMQQRTAAQQQVNDQLKAALGDQRYADYVRSGDRDYQQLTQLEQRQNLPAGTAAQAYDLRNALSQESNRIMDDASLDNDQKRAALQSLAQNTRAQLVTTLGPTASDAYLKTAPWLTTVEHGAAVTFMGGGTRIRGLPNPNGSSTPTVGETRIITSGGGGGGVLMIGNGTTIITSPTTTK